MYFLTLTTPSRDPGRYGSPEPLRDDAVEPGGLEPVEPALRLGEVAAVRRQLEPLRLPLELLAPLLERQLVQLLALPEQDVEGDELRRDLGRELADPALGRVEPELHRVEVELPLLRDHDLAVERGVGREQLPERLELREVAEQRPLVARPERKLAAVVLEHAAEPVPLRLVLPVAGRELLDELGLHRRKRDVLAGHAGTKLAAMRRVAVTGLGAVTPLGNDAPSTWRAAVAGESGIDFIKSFDASGFPVRVAAEVKDFDPAGLVSTKEARRLDRNVLLALAAAVEAKDDAALNGFDPARVGVVFGSAIGGFLGIMEQSEILDERGPDRVSPYFIPSVLVDSASGQIAISLGMRGPNYAPVSACATGSHAVGEGAEIIRRGDADVVLAGGTEACMHPLILAGFCAMRGLAAEDEHPPRASRPFDATRAGFVMGEGACVLVLEDLESAQKRDATIYAEVLGYGASNDAYHMAAPDPASVGVAEMMRAALARARVNPSEVDYVNAHGTSTPLGDLAETKALKDVFGDHAYELAVSSTKSMMGHCFGAAGAIEAMMCVLAIHEGTIPPTINYEHPDPECDLDYVPNEAREAKVDVALSNAMGLGGHNGCVLLGRVLT